MPSFSAKSSSSIIFKALAIKSSPSPSVAGSAIVYSFLSFSISSCFGISTLSSASYTFFSRGSQFFHYIVCISRLSTSELSAVNVAPNDSKTGFTAATHQALLTTTNNYKRGKIYDNFIFYN